MAPSANKSKERNVGKNKTLLREERKQKNVEKDGLRQLTICDGHYNT